jgi:hypothetical protein
MNLIPKAAINGVYKPFWFGSGIHYALEKFYNPLLKEDPESVFDAWFNLQWNGGEIHEHELEQFKDRLPYQIEDKWFIRGLEEVLPDPSDPEYEELHQTGMGMMRFYKDYAERSDNFVVVSTEHMFSVPILDPKTNDALYMPDYREMPEDWEPSEEENIYGPLMRFNKSRQLMKQVHARGRQDMIVYSEETGNYVIFDHKTAKTIDEDYFDHTDLDEQCTTYLWAAEREAVMYDLPYKKIAGIMYQALRKAYPKPPTIMARGLPSLNRQTESTTPQLFEQCIKELNLENLFRTDDKMQRYYTYLVEKGDKQFVQRHPVERNESQKLNAGLRIYMEALDMLDNPYIYPNPSKDYSCLRCPFRAPCLAIEKGYDYEGMISDGYESNFDR